MNNYHKSIVWLNRHITDTTVGWGLVLLFSFIIGSMFVYAMNAG